MNELFGNAGVNIQYVRVPLSSSDFATNDFTHDDIAPPNTDLKLQQFQINQQHDYIIPLLHQMRDNNPKIKLVGSAWSAPGWLKDGNDKATRKGLIGGTLDANYVTVYAQYLTKLITAFTNRDIPFDAITMQNEPAFSPGDYAGMLLSAE